MNLGNRRITNNDLAAAFERLGYADPTPYQASGNVILPHESAVDPAELSAQLEVELGYEVPVFVRSTAQLRAIVASPFAGKSGREGGKPQIVFLGPATVSAADTVFGPADRFELIGTEIHWLPPGGLAETGDLHKRLDLAVGPNTVRTLGTIERIVRKLPA
jgi:uncharacterized protein (DUF1697 family)